MLFGALVLLFSVTVVAQGHRGERRGFDLEKMTEQLDLTPEQATQLKTIHEEQRAAFAKLAEGLPEGERPDREQMRAMMKDSREKMMKVLNAEQQEKLKAERENRKRGERSRSKPKMNNELRSELRAYRAETITPKFVEVRTAFDRKLNPTERAQITKLREAVRTELGEKGLSRLTSRDSGPRTGQRGGHKGHNVESRKASEPDAKQTGSRDGRRTELRAFMQTHKTDVQAVRAIVRNHESELAAVRSEIDAAKVQWKKDGDAIRAKHLSAEDLARYKVRGKKRSEMRGKHKGQSEGNHATKARNGEAFGRADRGAFMFLLMDPKSMSADGFDEVNDSNLHVFPNPANTETTVKFDVRKSGPVRVELIDASGKVITTLLNTTREADSYELPVQLPNSMGKTGLIRVTDAIGVRTTQVTRG